MFIVPFEYFSLIWRANSDLCSALMDSYQYGFFIVSLIWRGNSDLCSALMDSYQYGFFIVSRLLWHGNSVFKVSFGGPVTFTPVGEHLIWQWKWMRWGVLTMFVFSITTASFELLAPCIRHVKQKWNRCTFGMMLRNRAFDHLNDFKDLFNNLNFTLFFFSMLCKVGLWWITLPVFLRTCLSAKDNLINLNIPFQTIK